MRTFRKFGKDEKDENGDYLFVTEDPQGIIHNGYRGEQHNIMALVGNGFDTAIMKAIGKSHTPSYGDFYNYIEYERDLTDDNEIWKQIKKSKDDGKTVDVEELISDIIDSGKFKHEEIKKWVYELCGEESKYLNDIVTYDVLYRINEKLKDKLLGYQSMSFFMDDIAEEDIDKFKVFFSGFPFEKGITNKGDLFNYLFVDFCYTQLIDDYLYLDGDTNLGHKKSTRNIQFWYPSKKEDKSNRDNWNYNNGYVLYEVIHPHGYQNVPRSILFGPGQKDGDNVGDKKRKFLKSYCAQYPRMYGGYFKDAELFIAFGMSLSHADGWWMNMIYNELMQRRKKRLIIYFFLADLAKEKLDSKSVINQEFYDWFDYDTVDDEIEPKINPNKKSTDSGYTFAKKCIGITNDGEPDPNSDIRGFIKDYFVRHKRKKKTTTIKEVIKEELVIRFLKAVKGYLNDEDFSVDRKYNTIKNRVCVVLFTRNTTSFLGFTPVFEPGTKGYPRFYGGNDFEGKVCEYDKNIQPQYGCSNNNTIVSKEKQVGKVIGDRHDYIC